MNSAGNIAQTPPNLEGDRLRDRLQGVFRILAKPDHALREEAQKLRQEISCTWRIRAAQGKWFPWPTTSTCRGGRGLRGVDWRPQGMLSVLGYRVGETEPTEQEIRRCILEYAFECDLPPVNDPAYHEEWGQPRTAQRLHKLANTLATLTRNAKRRNAVSLARAIHDWERDLAFLRDRYYVDFFHFGWPATSLLQ
jgi:hypothetical protein